MELATEKITELRRDGFAFFRNVFSAEAAQTAHSELLRWYDVDNAHRASGNIREAVHTGPAGKTAKTDPSHVMIDAYGKSPALDKIVDQILTHPQFSAVLRAGAGPRVKLRGYNIRMMSGRSDQGADHSLPVENALPHEWHRDSPGEFGIGILLTDVPEGGNGGTALMRGSHLFPYCPRWNTLLSSFWRASKDGTVTGPPALARFNIFNRLLSRRLKSRATEACGKRGDCYLFFNDTWHGRYPNLHAGKTMIVLVGGFPTEFPFPDEVKKPAPEVLASLPASIRSWLTPQPDNADKSSLIHWMESTRKGAFPFGLFFMARLERRIAGNVVVAWCGVRALLRVMRSKLRFLKGARSKA